VVQTGAVSGITWSRQESAAGDVVSTSQVTMSVPSTYFVTGKLHVAFSFDLSDSLYRKSGGIDDLIMIAQGVCNDAGKAAAKDGDQQHNEHHFRLDNLNSGRSKIASASNKIAAEPSLDGSEEDGGPHCRAEDFPCEGGERAFICHYAFSTGYRTYCVKEEDSIVVAAFPDTDYCGPCVGFANFANPNN